MVCRSSVSISTRSMGSRDLANSLFTQPPPQKYLILQNMIALLVRIGDKPPPDHFSMCYRQRSTWPQPYWTLVTGEAKALCLSATTDWTGDSDEAAGVT